VITEGNPADNVRQEYKETAEAEKAAAKAVTAANPPARKEVALARIRP
jgi:hypothetical protein